MKAQELRIGNLILFEEDGTVFYVKTISKEGLDVYNQIESTWIETDQFAGIPLTEEWLIKFGFSKLPNQSYVNGFEFILLTGSLEFNGIGTFGWLSGKDKSLVVNTLCSGNYVCDTVRFVHQLQNLYFALTGQELEIKEPENLTPI